MVSVMARRGPSSYSNGHLEEVWRGCSGCPKSKSTFLAHCAIGFQRFPKRLNMCYPASKLDLNSFGIPTRVHRVKDPPPFASPALDHCLRCLPHPPTLLTCTTQRALWWRRPPDVQAVVDGSNYKQLKMNACPRMGYIDTEQVFLADSYHFRTFFITLLRDLSAAFRRTPCNSFYIFLQKKVAAMLVFSRPC